MSQYKIFDYEKLDDYKFEELPKGYVFKVAMNPYTGYVLLDLEKHESSSHISLEIMRRIVADCDVLERNGSFDPLRDYVRMTETGELTEMLADAARTRITAFEGRKNKKELVRASGQVMEKSNLREVI